MAIKKKPNLAAALAARPAEMAEEPAPAASSGAAQPAAQARRRTYREDKKQIGGWFPLTVSLQLDELRLRLSRERGRKITLNELQAEAYNDLFKKYGMAEIAPGAPE